MLFNSVDFAIYIVAVFIIYWFVVHKNLKIQNLFLLLASYFFYGWWDWRFLSLIAFSSLVDFLLGIAIEKSDKVSRRRFLLLVSLMSNLGLLGVFKYLNFFIHNFVIAFTFFGITIEPPSVSLILPVGISFYTFQTLSYTIDVYRKKIHATSNWIEFFAFVSFFPQLVAGPIERASNLIPQFKKKRAFIYDQAVDGSQQILWGLFKKIVIADNCAIYVNEIFGGYEDLGGSTLMLGAILFAFQIYGDFSGYSDIAIGISKLFGFNLMRNFAYPYFSRDIAEFWRTWHISLSTWFRDYIYISIGGSKINKFTTIRNVLVIFLVSGFWHGANWTFIFWGLTHFLLYIPLLLYNRNRKNIGQNQNPTFKESLANLPKVIFTFLMVSLAWVFFRAPNIDIAFKYLEGIFSISLFTVPEIAPSYLMLLLVLFVGFEWKQRFLDHPLKITSSKVPKIFEYGMYILILLFIYFLGGTSADFIYFQF